MSNIDLQDSGLKRFLPLEAFLCWKETLINFLRVFLLLLSFSLLSLSLSPSKVYGPIKMALRKPVLKPTVGVKMEARKLSDINVHLSLIQDPILLKNFSVELRWSLQQQNVWPEVSLLNFLRCSIQNNYWLNFFIASCPNLTSKEEIKEPFGNVAFDMHDSTFVHSTFGRTLVVSPAVA